MNLFLFLPFWNVFSKQHGFLLPFASTSTAFLFIPHHKSLLCGTTNPPILWNLMWPRRLAAAHSSLSAPWNQCSTPPRVLLCRFRLEAPALRSQRERVGDGEERLKMLPSPRVTRLHEVDVFWMSLDLHCSDFYGNWILWRYEGQIKMALFLFQSVSIWVCCVEHQHFWTVVLWKGHIS